MERKISVRGSPVSLATADAGSFSQLLGKSLVHLVNSTASAQSHLRSSNNDGSHWVAKSKQHPSSSRWAAVRTRCCTLYGKVDGYNDGAC